MYTANVCVPFQRFLLFFSGTIYRFGFKVSNGPGVQFEQNYINRANLNLNSKLWLWVIFLKCKRPEEADRHCGHLVQMYRCSEQTHRVRSILPQFFDP